LLFGSHPVLRWSTEGIIFWKARVCLTIAIPESSFVGQREGTPAPDGTPAAQLILTASAHGAADPIRLIVPGHRGAACSAGGFAGVKR
jgi:hypothetical protein